MFTLKDSIPRLKSYNHLAQNNLYSARQESTAQELSFDVGFHLQTQEPAVPAP